jgi:sugar/nucleoside kinase (ribokinase family)
MPVLAVGSVALDTIKSPYGKLERGLGGAGTFFALAASYFTEVRLIAVVGDDFGKEHEEVFRRRGISSAGIEHAPGKTFHWSGEYGKNPNQVTTHATELNVFEEFEPKIPKDWLDTEFVFLANIDPTLQSRVRHQMSKAKLVGLDTIHFWIKNTPAELTKTIGEIDIMLINDGEALEIAGEHNLLRAANKILAKGPKALVIKHGEYGATIFFHEGAFGFGSHPFRAPALPLDEVRDPTGAGDAFAGGFMGYIASQGELTRETVKRAMFYGGVMGGFAVERFGTERLQGLSRDEIDARFQLFREMTHIE